MTTQQFLQRLAPLARHDSRHIAHQQRFSFVSAFVTRSTETVQSINMPVAGLLLAVEGIKKIWWAGQMFCYGPARPFALPTGVYVDVVNEPDKRSGRYRALFPGFSPDLVAEARRRWSVLAAGHVTEDPSVEIRAALASAILHTSEALAGHIPVSSRVTEQRILEVLLLMAEAGAAPLRPDIQEQFVHGGCEVDRPGPPRACMGSRRSRGATMQVGAHIAPYVATRRDRVPPIVAEERMRAARSMLLSGRSSVADAAVFAGYTSLSHFAKRFQSTLRLSAVADSRAEGK